jgi:hypothetical protein
MTGVTLLLPSLPLLYPNGLFYDGNGFNTDDLPEYEDKEE